MLRLTRSFAKLEKFPRCYSTLKSGQPLFETRPHRIQSGDITPFIPAEEYYGRRLKLLSKMKENSVAIIPGNDLQFATNSVFYKFRQDPNFFYLTGFLEANSSLILVKHKGDAGKAIMFVPPIDAKDELWNGESTGPKNAVNIFNADEAYSNKDLSSKLPTLLSEAEHIYLDEPANRFAKFFQASANEKNSIISVLANLNGRKTASSVNNLIESMRITKSENEIDCMRVASEISALAYHKAYSRKFDTEHQLAAFLDFEFRFHGCEEQAYEPVVAGGKHALTIHYVRNDDVLRDGELVLTDAGGRFGGYCADISRTWPVNGRFTEPQRDLYQAVLNAQKDLIKLCLSGTTLADIHQESESLLRKELKQIGIDVSGPQLRSIYPHYIGHHLGIDVHDIKTASSQTKLESGQVITIEPGIYISADSGLPKHFHDIGIRIEDNVVIGDTGYEVLTVDTPKEIQELERV